VNKHAPEHEHEAKNEPTTRPTHEQVAKKACDIYQKEGRPQGHADENWSGAEAQLQHTGSGHPADHDDHDHLAMHKRSALKKLKSKQ